MISQEILNLAAESKNTTARVIIELIATMLGSMTKESALLMLQGGLDYSNQIEILDGLRTEKLQPMLTYEAYQEGLAKWTAERDKALASSPASPPQVRHGQS